MTLGKPRTELAAARKSVGHTQESLAEALGVDRSTVVRWEAGDYAPLPYLWPKLARLLGHTPSRLREMINGARGEHDRIELNADIASACIWLDKQSGTVPGTSRRRVATALRQMMSNEAGPRGYRHANISRKQVVDALSEYYGVDMAQVDLYRANGACTSIVARPEWLELDAELSLSCERIRVQSRSDRTTAVDTSAAVRRLAEAQQSGIRLANEPIYRLIEADVRHLHVGGTLAVAEFLQYALAVDLLEGELLDAIADDSPIQRGNLPLRDRYLPTLQSVLEIKNRECAGGVLALFAIRSNPKKRGEPAYTFLVQERSSHVVNAPNQLSVIPKGFHQPLNDYYADAPLASTLLRELEEELLGRADLDNTLGSVRRSMDPLHRRRMSGPLQWLTAEPGRLRLECTGLGINLVSGNYEFACLAVVEDGEFWQRFGGHVETNWEVNGVRRYSTNDADAIEHLFNDESWTNEGQFALSLGLDRLRRLST